MDYDIDWRELNGLKNWYGKQPSRMRTAVSQMLNHFAFGTRTKAVAEIGKSMTVRAPGFVRKQLWSTKATASKQISFAGSLPVAKSKARGLFTGWAEQEKGARMARQRLGTLASRGGTRLGKMRPSMRLKPGTDVADIRRDTPKGGVSNYGGFIAMLIRKKDKRLIRVKGSFYKLPRGKGLGRMLHGPTQSGKPLRSKVLTLIQEPTKKQPRKNRWLNRSRAKYFAATDIDKLWERTASAVMGRPAAR